MKKHLILSLGLVLTSPLLLAQNTGSTSDDDRDQKSAQPATPAIPAVPGAGSSSSPTVEGPTTNEDGDTSGSARSGKNSAGATGNPNTKSAKTRTRSGQGGEFGSLDTNGDNKISQDELKANVELGARFKDGDANSDGFLSRGEFAKLQSGSPASSRGGNTGRDSEGRDQETQERTEGSDRTDKDDELNRRLPGQ
jgi:hypothetical protein